MSQLKNIQSIFAYMYVHIYKACVYKECIYTYIHIYYVCTYVCMYIKKMVLNNSTGSALI